jgi:hypothetical protein
VGNDPGNLRKREDNPTVCGYVLRKPWNGQKRRATMYATISIEPQGKRYACEYEPEHQAEALQALNTMGHGVTVLRTEDAENWDDNETWKYQPGVGWYA